MGILETLRIAPKSGLLNPGAIASPWADGSLTQVIWSEVFGEQAQLPLSRTEAMTVPAVQRARDLICTTVMRYPLIAMKGGVKLPEDQQPLWMSRTDGNVTPQLRAAWTVDDLLFYGASLWTVERGSEGQVLSADRLPFEWWSVEQTGAILVHGKAVDSRSVVYFPSHTDALLVTGATTIRSARSTSKSVERRANSPVPVMEIHQNDPEVTVRDADAKALVTAYNAARRDPEGATVYTPNHIQLVAHGDKADSGALIEARNASRLDIANHTGLPASMLEGSTAAASLTYVTTDGKRSELIDYGVLPWVETLTGRLSMDDVMPRGTRCYIDLSDLYSPNPSATGAERQD